MNPSKPNASGKRQTCMEMLQEMLDGDATQEQKERFKEHMEACMPCYKTYNLELTIRELLKTKCCGNGAPPELIERIKTNISQNTPS